MEQGTVVAIVALAGSFLTVMVTGAVNIWSKWIESNQRVREHQLSLRSAYVTKKIETGQAFVGRNNLRRNALYSEYQYFYNYQLQKRKNKHLLDRSESVKAEMGKVTIQADIYTALYFDLEDLNTKALRIHEEMDVYINILNSHSNNPNPAAYSNELDQNITNWLVSSNKLIELYKDMNKVVRDELAKYDII